MTGRLMLRDSEKEEGKLKNRGRGRRQDGTEGAGQQIKKEERKRGNTRG